MSETDPPGRVVLALNAGSSSLKFALFRAADDGPTHLAEGAVERIGLDASRLWLRHAKAALHEDVRPYVDHAEAVASAFAALQDHAFPAPDAVGHRIVHGGPRHTRPERIDAALLAALNTAIPFAPLHLPVEIRGIEIVAARFPTLPQVACFDTAFHASLPEIAQRLPLPRALFDAGIRRYGFHGLSYEYIVARLGAVQLQRAVIAHLGNGASLVAVRDGSPLDTTMGLTPTGGVMMGTRTGDLDPGVMLHLLDAGWDSRRLEHLVDFESGLLGVSGSTSDVKALLARRGDDARAAMALEMFAYQVRKSIGALVAVLGGIDTLVFTGGIGENAPAVRGSCCEGLEFLGVHVDPARNASSESVISSDASACVVRVVPTDEEAMIARHTLALT